MGETNMEILTDRSSTRRGLLLGALLALTAAARGRPAQLERMRRVEVLRDERWVTIPMMKLQEGEHFRLWEPTGEQVGGVVYRALDQPRIYKGVCSVSAEPVS